ncbi:hypothetical protein CYMTET_35072, partial [Cymbomonas tetramitiformis]
VAAPAPQDQEEAFPSLDKMEEEIRGRMRQVRAIEAKGGVSKVPKPKPKSPPKQRVDRTEEASSSGNAEQIHPEQKAAQWALRNKWFGSDMQMTEAAYAIHDQLVGVDRVDPS